MSRNGLPWYQRFPRDLIEGTVGMSYDTKLQYWALIDLIHLYNNALPDDAGYICGIFNCSKQSWRKVRADLISLGKIEINNGVISNKRAENVLKSTKKFAEKQAKNRSEFKENNALTSQTQQPTPNQNETKLEPPQPQPQEQDSEVVPPSESKEEEEGAQARVSVSVFEEVMLAVGVDPKAPPKFWRGSQAATHVLGWQVAYSLTDDEVVEAARMSRADNPEPPDGPKALDRFMAGYAKAKASAEAAGKPSPAAKPKAAPKPPASPEDRLAFYAEMVNSDKYIPPSMIGNTMRDALLHSGLVTKERLRDKGIYA